MLVNPKIHEIHRDELHVAAVKLENAMEDRDDAIREAYRDGLTPTEIGREVRLSRQRVWQIVSQRD
jgi:DNA-directed RNA polymerase specialized sigma subunit